MPESGSLPRFLTRLTWVDFRKGLEDEKAFRRLVSGIRGEAPGAGDSLFRKEEGNWLKRFFGWLGEKLWHTVKNILIAFLRRFRKNWLELIIVIVIAVMLWQYWREILEWLLLIIFSVSDYLNS